MAGWVLDSRIARASVTIFLAIFLWFGLLCSRVEEGSAMDFQLTGSRYPEVRRWAYLSPCGCIGMC